MLDVNELAQEDILVSVRVKLCIHGFGHGIYCEGSDFTICKFNIKNPRVEDGIVMDLPNDVSLSIVLTADYGLWAKVLLHGIIMDS